MGISELLVAVLVTGISCINAAIPAGAYLRLKDPRFLLLSGASGALALLGAFWTWGQLPLGPPGWVAVNLPTLLLALFVTVLLLAATLWPRNA